MGLAISTAAAVGLGRAVYEWSGRPNTWEERQRHMEATRFVSSANPLATQSRLISGLGLDIPRDRIAYRQWTDDGTGALAFDKTPARAI